MSPLDRTLAALSILALDDVAREAKALTLPSWHHDRVLDIDLLELEMLALGKGEPDCAKTWTDRPRWSVDRDFEQPLWARGAA